MAPNSPSITTSPWIVTSTPHGSLVSDHKRGEGLVVASGPNPDNETYTVTLKPGEGVWTALGVDVFQDESLPGTRFARGADRFVLTEVEAELARARRARPESFPSCWPLPQASASVAENPPMAAIDGDPKTGWGVTHRRGATIRFSRCASRNRCTRAPDSILTVRLHHDSDLRRATIGRFRLALSSATYSWPENGESEAQDQSRPADNPSRRAHRRRGQGPAADVAEGTPHRRRTSADDEQKDARSGLLRMVRAGAQPELYVRLARLRAERSLLDAAIPRVVLTEATRPRITRILPRANWMDETHEIVEPAIPAFLGKLETGGRRATRLDLANWLVSPRNPLTARVFVNRLWRQFFGTGLSKVLDDLGSQGEWPVHPELLDWLAAEFMHPEWKLRARTIGICATSSAPSSPATPTGNRRSPAPQLDERDPDNRLLARQSRFRVDAEIVHDIALSVSGLLVEEFRRSQREPV